jgi:signal transduction histidine kinase
MLSSSSGRERLEAARFLERAAVSDDVAALRAAYQRESILWVREALKRGIARASLHPQAEGPAARSIEPVTEDDELDDVYAAAVHDIADQLVHEIAPLIGTARLHASRELAGVADSRTIRDLEQIERVLKAIDELARASSAPVLRSMNLADLATEVALGQQDRTAAEIQLAGDDPFFVQADAALLQIILRNAIANAVEAVEAVGSVTLEPIVVSWGKTPREYRLTVLDRGVGLPQPTESLFDMGISSKGGKHSGMGLYLVRRAARSLRGEVTLEGRDRGVLFEFRWGVPEVVADP